MSSDTHIDDINVQRQLDIEKEAGLDKLEIYLNFEKKIQHIKRETLKYLINKKENGKRIVAFGAAAKAGIFLNYCGIGIDFIDYIIDQTPYKQNLYMPGAHIPIYPLEKLLDDKPDIVAILAWNWTDEILNKISFIKNYGGKAVTFIPEIKEYF